MKLSQGIRKWVASTLTIGSGGSAGAEGPIVTIGAVIGSSFSRLLRLNPQNTATLLGCGAAAGIASVFNAPFAGIFFVMEILLRDFSLRTFTPIVIAAVISAVATQAYLGADAIFPRPDYFTTETAAQAHQETLQDEPFSFRAFGAMEVPNYLMLGIVCGVAAAIFIRVLDFSESTFRRIKVHPIIRPGIGGAILGLFGLAFLLIMGADDGIPPFYGNGYPVIERLLDPATYYADGQLRTGAAFLLFIMTLGVVKALATCITLGSGGSGGLFAPSLLIGASVGGSFGLLVNSLGWFPAASPGHYALVGMAAMVAATTHAPLTAILMVYEITRSYELILPLMLAAVISTIIARLVFRDSIYTVNLTRMGIRVGSMSDLTLLRRLTVRDVRLMPAVSVHQDDSAQRLLELSEQHSVTDFVVVDDDQQYAGVVTSDDLREALVYREAVPLLQVNELMRSDLPTVSRDDTLDVVLELFSRHETQSLAVVNERNREDMAGIITRSALLARYDAGVSVNVGPLRIHGLPNDLGHPRLGLAVSRRVGNAVVRNRNKRMLREAFRLSQHDLPKDPAAYDLVVSVRPHESLPLDDYRNLLLDAAKRLEGIWNRRRSKSPTSPSPPAE
jgi:CIC family chloride channel protein